MSAFVAAAAILAAAYLVGSIPFGYLAGRLKGIDVRRHGSGNIGATNVLRVVGKPWGIAVFALDFLKGLVPTLLAARLSIGGLAPDLAGIAGATGAILGHNYTCWLGFRGGKGIAVSAGALLALMPFAALVAVAVWCAGFFATRIVSVGSLLAAAALPVAVLGWIFWRGAGWPLFWFALAGSAMAIWRHRSNIRGLLCGTEHRFTGGRPDAREGG